jgi:hypothetical protein
LQEVVVAVIGIAAKVLEIGAINTSASKSLHIDFGGSSVWAHIALTRVAVNDDDGTAIASVSEFVEGGTSKKSTSPGVFAGFKNKDCTRVTFLLQVVDCQATAQCTVEFFG